MDRRCKATNRTGEPCSAAHHRDGWCRWHHPDLAETRKAERVAGGEAKSNRRRARKLLLDARMEPRAVEGLLCRGMLQVMSGRMTPGQLSAIAAGARAFVAVREAGEVEERLAAVEASLAQSAPTDLRRVR